MNINERNYKKNCGYEFAEHNFINFLSLLKRNLKHKTKNVNHFLGEIKSRHDF